jgi:Helix-turn-helix domain
VAEDAYLDLAALSRVAGLSVRTLRDRIHDAVDPIPAYRPGAGKLLVRRSEFDRWMARRRYRATTVDGIVEDVLRELAGRL